VRRPAEALIFARAHRTADAALALWLGHPAANLDLLQDLMWAWCETTSWVWPAHEGRHADLGSSGLGRQLAEVAFMLSDVIEPEVQDRVRAEVERRLLDPAYDWRRPDWWQTAPMNWNHVCNSNVIQAALYVIRDPGVLASYVHPIIERLAYAIDGFGEDGGCLEGPGYWEYGFGHFLDAAVALRERTGGALDLVNGCARRGKVARISRYPVATHVAGPLRSTFADSSHGWLRLDTALKVNSFVAAPELYAMVERRPDGLPAFAQSRLDRTPWRTLSLWDGGPLPAAEDLADHLLPDLGQVKLRQPSGEVLMALAGSNDVPHNHNDVGSFMYYARGRLFLTDPGAPEYTSKTFGPARYEILFTRSRGHSVPVVNGLEQREGAQFRGSLEVGNLNGAGEKSAVIEMARAYPAPSLTRLARTLTLRADGSLGIEDAFEFAEDPASVEEAFITLGEAEVTGRGSVRITCDGATATLAAVSTPGRFSCERLVEESKEGRTGDVVTRISFVPSGVSRGMRLSFEVR
jgi:hypothetical protein